MFVVIAYDICDDRRRIRVHKALKNFGRPVQYSTFECLLDPPQITLLQRTVGRLIKPGADEVAYYCLCRVCEEQTEVISGTPRSQRSRIILI